LCNLILKLKKSKIEVTYKPYSPEDARRLVQNRIGSIEKASKMLNFQYSDDLEKGLTDLITWRLKNN
jgi:UDP-glucose 4-epimerase